MTVIRVGQGFDAHRFAENRRLVLGGVEIDYELGMAAHSDGDVALHALIDALLGAAGLGDIGGLFPDTDAQYENIDSRILLRESIRQIHAAGYVVGNIDLTIIAQKPKLAAYKQRMRETIADDLEVAVDSVNVKATTTEKMGFTGRGEGIAASAVALIEKR